MAFYRSDEQSVFFEKYSRKVLSLVCYGVEFHKHQVTGETVLRHLNAFLGQLEPFKNNFLVRNFIIDLYFTADGQQQTALIHLLLDEYSQLSPDFWRIVHRLCTENTDNRVLAGKVVLLAMLNKHLTWRLCKRSMIYEVDPSFDRLIQFLEFLGRNGFSVLEYNGLHRLIVSLVVGSAHLVDEFIANRYSAVLTQYSEHFGDTPFALLGVILPYLAKHSTISYTAWARIDRLCEIVHSRAEHARSLNYLLGVVSALPQQMSIANPIFNAFTMHLALMSPADDVESLFRVIKALPEILLIDQADFERFIHHIKDFGFLCTDEYLSEGPNHEVCLVYSQEDRKNYVANMVRLFGASENADDERINTRETDHLASWLSSQQFGAYLDIVNAYPLDQGVCFAAIVIEQVATPQGKKRLNLAATQQYFEACWQVAEATLRGEEWEYFDFKKILRIYPGLFLTNNVESFEGFLAFASTDTSPSKAYLENIFREGKSLRHQPWENGLDSLPQLAQRVGQLGYRGISVLALHAKRVPELLDSEMRPVLDRLLQFYSECSSAIFAGNMDDEVGVFGKLILKIYRLFPDLFLVKNDTLFDVFLSSYLRFSRVYQAHFRPVSRFYSSRLHVNSRTKVLRQLCEADFRALTKGGYVTDMGEITKRFQRGTSVNDSDRAAEHTGLLEDCFAESLIIYGFVLEEFKSQIREMINGKNERRLCLFFNGAIDVIRLAGENKAIKADGPVLVLDDLKDLSRLTEANKRWVISTLNQLGYITEDGVIVNNDFNRLVCEMYEQLTNQTMLWVSELITILNSKLAERHHLSQLFVFIPRMNPLWKDTKTYFDLLSSLLPRVETATQLRNMYLLLQSCDDVKEIRSLVFVNPTTIPVRFADWDSLPDTQQATALQYVRHFKMSNYKHLCLELTFHTFENVFFDLFMVTPLSSLILLI